MNYNKSKRVTGLIGAILTVLLGVTSFIGGLVFTIKMFSDGFYEFMTTEMVAFVLMTVSGILMIIFGGIQCKPPKVKNGKLCTGLSATIVALSFSLISIISCIILEASEASFFLALIIGYDTFFFVLELLFFLAITTLDIIALCLKPAKNGEVSPEFLAEMEKTKVLKLKPDVADNVRALKTMKDEGKITQEEFNDKFKKIAETFKEKILKGKVEYYD